ncbi:hypothetical protein SALBM311S_11298 [Streptomyces alboniger]
MVRRATGRTLQEVYEERDPPRTPWTSSWGCPRRWSPATARCTDDTDRAPTTGPAADTLSAHRVQHPCARARGTWRGHANPPRRTVGVGGRGRRRAWARRDARRRSARWTGPAPLLKPDTVARSVRSTPSGYDLGRRQHREDDRQAVGRAAQHRGRTPRPGMRPPSCPTNGSARRHGDVAANRFRVRAEPDGLPFGARAVARCPSPPAPAPCPLAPCPRCPLPCSRSAGQRRRVRRLDQPLVLPEPPRRGRPSCGRVAVRQSAARIREGL